MTSHAEEWAELGTMRSKVHSLVESLNKIATTQKENSPVTAITCREASDMIELLWLSSQRNMNQIGS